MDNQSLKLFQEVSILAFQLHRQETKTSRCQQTLSRQQDHLEAGVGPNLFPSLTLHPWLHILSIFIIVWVFNKCRLNFKKFKSIHLTYNTYVSLITPLLGRGIQLSNCLKLVSVMKITHSKTPKTKTTILDKVAVVHELPTH